MYDISNAYTSICICLKLLEMLDVSEILAMFEHDVQTSRH